MMNLDVLLDYTNKMAPPDDSYRDLFDFINVMDRRTEWDGSCDRRIDLAFEVCGLRRNESTLQQAGKEHLVAVAATILAMSFILRSDRRELEASKQRLMQTPIENLNRELRELLKKGDCISVRNLGLELKNFSCLGDKMAVFCQDAQDGYESARRLLRAASECFAKANNLPMSPRVGQAFKSYFGSPDEEVVVTDLPFDRNAPLFARLSSATGRRRRHEVVRMVLQEIASEILDQGKIVRLYFGGRRSSTHASTCAYATIGSPRLHTRNPAHVHLLLKFFEASTAERGRRLVHELTHVFTGTGDHKYGQWDCQDLVGILGIFTSNSVEKALTNADSYAFFVNEAFG